MERIEELKKEINEIFPEMMRLSDLKKSIKENKQHGEEYLDDHIKGTVLYQYGYRDYTFLLSKEECINLIENRSEQINERYLELARQLRELQNDN